MGSEQFPSTNSPRIARAIPALRRRIWRRQILVAVGDSAQEYDNPRFRGILLRKSYTEMTNLMDEMERIYLPLGGRKSDVSAMRGTMIVPFRVIRT